MKLMSAASSGDKISGRDRFLDIFWIHFHTTWRILLGELYKKAVCNHSILILLLFMLVQVASSSWCIAT